MILSLLRTNLQENRRLRRSFKLFSQAQRQLRPSTASRNNFSNRQRLRIDGGRKCRLRVVPPTPRNHPVRRWNFEKSWWTLRDERWTSTSVSLSPRILPSLPQRRVHRQLDWKSLHWASNSGKGDKLFWEGSA